MKNLFLSFLLFLTGILFSAEQLQLQLSTNRDFVNCGVDTLTLTVDVSHNGQANPTGVLKIMRNNCYYSTIYLDNYSNNHYTYDCNPCIQTDCFTEIQNFKIIYEGDANFASAESNVKEIIVDALPYATMSTYYVLGEFVFLDITTQWQIDVVRRNQTETANPIETTVTFNHEWEWHVKNSEESITGEFFPTTYSDTDELMEVVVTMTDTVTGRYSTSRFYFFTIPLVDATADEFNVDSLHFQSNSSVLENDIGYDLVAVIDNYPQHGDLYLNSDGTFIYHPFAGFEGTDSFSYMAMDKFYYMAESKTVTLNVAIPQEP